MRDQDRQDEVMVCLPDDLKSRALVSAEQAGISLNEFVNEAIREKLTQREKPQTAADSSAEDPLSSASSSVEDTVH